MKKRKVGVPLYNSLDEAFEMFAKIHDALGEPYKVAAYRRAIINRDAAPEDARISRYWPDLRAGFST